MNPDACCRGEFEEPIDTALPGEEQWAKILQYGYVAECNDALVQRRGLERANEMIGAPVTEAALDMEMAHRVALSLIRSGYRYSTIEGTALDRTGKRSYFLHSHWGIVEGGKLQRVWGSSRDITELRGIEAQFRHV
jgi:hypothetical protein